MKLIYLLLCLLPLFPASAQNMVQPSDMNYELKLIKATWENTHGGLYRFITPAQLNKVFEEAYQKTERPLPLRSYFLLLSQLNAKLHCSHTYVSYYNNPEKIKSQVYSTYFLPLLFRFMEGEIIISHNLTDNPLLSPGTAIAAINSIPVAVIMDSLLTVSKADGLNGRDKQINNLHVTPPDIRSQYYCLFDIYFPLFFKEDLHESVYRLTLNNKGVTQEVIINGIKKAERENEYIKRHGALPVNEATWSTRELTPETMLFKPGDFATYNWKFDFAHYLDSTFQSIGEKGYKHLIIDIRENEGGSDAARDTLLTYLTPVNIRCANPVRRLYRYKSIPDSLKPYLDTWDDRFKEDKMDYTATTDGYYEKQNGIITCDSIRSNPKHFKGKIFLITDITNSSTTFILADCFKSNKLGTIVGEKTGGTQQGINGGQIFFFRLPRTGIEMDIPLIWQRPLIDRPDEGISPDYTIRTTLDDIRNHHDPQISFILKQL